METNSEVESLREIIKNKEQVIVALKHHCATLSSCFKEVLEALVVKYPNDETIYDNATKLLATLNHGLGIGKTPGPS